MDITKEQNLEVEYLENRIQQNESFDLGSEDTWQADLQAARSRRDANLPAEAEGQTVSPPPPPPGAEEPDVDDKGFMDYLEWGLSPFMFLGDGAAAPIAHDYESETVFGKAFEAFKVSGEAMGKRLFPNIDDLPETYGPKIAQRIAPNASPDVQQAMGVGLDFLTDPSVSLGIPAIMMYSRGLAAAAKGNSSGNIWQDGFQQIMGAADPEVRKTLSPLGELTKSADMGDKEAIEKINSIMSHGKAGLAAKDMSQSDVNTFIKGLDDAFGNLDAGGGGVASNMRPIKGQSSKTIAKVEAELAGKNPTLFKIEKQHDLIDPVILAKSADTNHATRQIKYNLIKINQMEDVEEFRKATHLTFISDYRTLKRPTGPEEATLQNKYLTDFLGRGMRKMYSAEDAYAWRMTLASSAEQVARIVRQVKVAEKMGIADRKWDVALDKAWSIHRILQEQALSHVVLGDKLLHGKRFTAKNDLARVAEFHKVSQAVEKSFLSSRAIKNLLKHADPNDPKVTNLMIEKAFRSTTNEQLFEVFVNSILSGPWTHGMNIASNSAVLLMRPTEKYIASGMAMARMDVTRATQEAKEANAMMHGLAEGSRDVLKIISNKARANGQRIPTIGKYVPDPKHSVDVPDFLKDVGELSERFRTPAISSERMGLTGYSGAAADVIGKIVRTPGDLLLTEDRGFKLLNYRMTVAADAAANAGKHAKSDMDFMQLYDYLRHNPDETVMQHGSDMADYYTFTNKLGHTGERFRKAVNTPIAKWFFPFFQTPTNLVKFGARHSIYGNIWKDLKPGLLDSSVDAATRDLARARLAMGTVATVGIASALGPEQLTGHVDKSSPLGKHLSGTSRPPYSIRFGDTWISYANIDILRWTLGSIANFRNVVTNLEMSDDDDMSLMQEAATVMLTPFIQTALDNYMLPQFGSLNHTFDALMAGDMENAQSEFKKVATALASPNFLSQMNRSLGEGFTMPGTEAQFGDNIYRMHDSIWEGIMSRVPMLSNLLEPHRDIWGDPALIPEGFGPDIISPVKLVPASNDPMDILINEVEPNLPTFKKELKGVKLTHNQRSELQRLTGKGVPGGLPLKDALQGMANTPFFQSRTLEGKKVLMEKMINTYHSQAQGFLISQDDELREKIMAKALKDQQQIMGPAQ